MDPPFDGISISAFHFHVIGRTVPSLCHFIFGTITQAGETALLKYFIKLTHTLIDFLYCVGYNTYR